MPAIAFLDGRLNKTMRVMEYGSGGSTAWYGRRVDHVTSVEHDPQWYDAVKRTIPANVDLVLCPEAQPADVPRPRVQASGRSPSLRSDDHRLPRSPVIRMSWSSTVSIG